MKKPGIDEICGMLVQAVADDARLPEEARENRQSVVCSDRDGECFLVVNGSGGGMRECFRKLFEMRPDLRGCAAEAIEQRFRTEDF